MKESTINLPDVAIALHYDGQKAPQVTAKGQGSVAERIMDIAREHDIPLHPDPELASVLSQIPLGDEIPEALYLAIAEVIAFAYLLAGKVPDSYPPADE